MCSQSACLRSPGKIMARNLSQGGMPASDLIESMTNVKTPVFKVHIEPQDSALEMFLIPADK